MSWALFCRPFAKLKKDFYINNKKSKKVRFLTL